VRTSLYHVQLNVGDAARVIPFYKDLFGYLEYRVLMDRFAVEFLRPRGIPALYDSPRDYPEYHAGYYAVFFEDPDRLKLEVAHVPGLTDRG